MYESADSSGAFGYAGSSDIVAVVVEKFIGIIAANKIPSDSAGPTAILNRHLKVYRDSTSPRPSTTTQKYKFVFDGTFSPPSHRRMSSPYASHSSSLANLSNAASSSAAAVSAAISTRAVPAGTLPPGTLVTVGKHNVTIERWLSEGTATLLSWPSALANRGRRICACVCGAIKGENETCGWECWRRGVFKESYRSG